MKISRKEVDHFIGHDPQDWINDCMYRLMNKKISVSDLRKEAKAMYSSYITHSKKLKKMEQA